MAANFTASDVQELRRATGAGMMDAKNALTSCDGDSAAAAQLLRETGIAKSAARSDRDNSDGIVRGEIAESADGGKVGAIVELRCETDFVAKSAAFSELAKDLLDAVLTNGEQAVADKQSAIDELKRTHQENIEIGRVERFEADPQADPNAVLDVYIHQQNGRGVNAVMVQLDGGSADIAHDIALHVASNRPKYMTRDDIPADVIEQERTTLETISRNEGKPEAALPKIIEGRLNGFYKDNALLEQKFVKDEKRSIADLLGDATLKRFAQIEIGA